MHAIVLGSAAGGGFPQWNSNSVACRRARAGDPCAPSRTQTSLAVSADGRSWVVLNASPDLRRQIELTPELQPQEGLRSSPIFCVVLTGGDVDAIAGLLTLRERQPFAIYATGAVHKVLDSNPIFGVLAPDVVARHAMSLDAPCPLPGPDGAPSGLTLELFAVPGKTPLYLETPGAAPPIIEGEQTVGALITHGDQRLYFVPGCARMTESLAERLQGANAVFFDATLWSDDEMLLSGAGTKTGQRMGHMSVSGPDGVIAAFEAIAVNRKILVHINNTNPILLEDSPERSIVRDSGWLVGEDGMRVSL
jgi:pyrroloquinoline quinone biosynthesis protein B